MIDTVTLDAFASAIPCCAISAFLSTPPVLYRSQSELRVQIDLQNRSGILMRSVKITVGKLLGTKVGGIFPTEPFDMPAGGTTTITLVFPPDTALAGSAPFINVSYISANAGNGTLSIQCRNGR